MLAGLPPSFPNDQSKGISPETSAPASAPDASDFADALKGAGATSAVDGLGASGRAVAVSLVGTLLPEMRTREFETVMLAVRRNDPSMLGSRVQEYAYEVVKTLQEAGIPVDNSGRAHVFEDYTTLDVFARLIADYPFTHNEAGAFHTYDPSTHIGPRLKEHLSGAFVDRMLALAENYRNPTRNGGGI